MIVHLIAAPVDRDVERVGEELHEEDIRREAERGEAAPAHVRALLGEDAEVIVVVDDHLCSSRVSNRVPLAGSGTKSMRVNVVYVL